MSAAPNATMPKTGKDWLEWINEIHEVGFHLSGISRILHLLFEDQNGSDMGLWHLSESVLKASQALDKITDKIGASHRPHDAA